MAWPKLDNTDALARNARHNARFSAVRLPLVIIVSGFLWQLVTPAVALSWAAAMLIVERVATSVRGRLARGEAEYAFPHLLTLALMSAIWVCFGLLLWRSDTELGRLAATIGLLSTALYGALGGQKDLRPATIVALPALCTLLVLLVCHAWTHWPPLEAAISTLATLGACASVMICAWALNQSDTTLERANRELEQAASQLAHNADLLEEMSAMAQAGGWRLDLKTGKLDWTAQTKRIHDVADSYTPTLEDALAFYTPDSRTRIQKAVEDAIESGIGWDLELQIRSARGVIKWVHANGKATIVDGAPIELLGAFGDISQRVHLEEELRQAQKLEAIGRLAGGIAHDFNNVLSAILDAANLLQNATPDDSRSAQLVAIILKATERASDLTSNLLAFSRQQVLAPKPTNLNTAITEAAALLAVLMPSDISIVVERHTEDVLALLDRGQLSSALVNLAINAKDAMPEGGALRMRASVRRDQGADFGVITIADTGTGIDPTIQSNIFDPFFTTKSADGGTGLGLAMVHGFVTQSGGHISVDSPAGAGTTFTLCFPLLAGRHETAAPANAGAPGTSPLAGMRVLLVDDDELVRAALALALRDEGCSVVEAMDGPEALRLYGDGGDFDLVVADVVLTSAMPGPQLTQELMAQNPSSRAVLISGYARDKLTESGKLPAGVSFLQKPFSTQTLASHLADFKVSSSQGDRAL